MRRFQLFVIFAVSAFGAFGLPTISSAIAAEKSAIPEIFAEDKKPRNALSESEQQDADDLKEKIFAEKNRLAQPSAAETELAKITEQAREISEQLAVRNRALGAVDALIEIFAGSPLTANNERAIDTAGADLSSPAYISRIKSYLQFVNSRPADFAGQNRLRKPIIAQAQALIANSQAQLNALVERQNQLKENRRRDGEKLRLLRAQLDAIYGYSTPAASLISHYDDADPDLSAQSFFAHEVAFIDAMQADSFDDLAEKHWRKLVSANNPFTGRKLSEHLRNYLRRAEARWREKIILPRADLREKMQKLPTLLKLYADESDPQTPGSLRDYEARVELISAYFRYAENLQTNLKTQLLMVEEQPFYLPDIFGERGQLLPPNAVTFSELTAPEIQRLPTAEIPAAAANMAGIFYYHGLVAGLPLAEQMRIVLSELLANCSTNSADAASVRKLTQKFSQVLSRLQTDIEHAYVDIAGLYPPYMSQRETVAKAAERYIQGHIRDYDENWRNDFSAPGFRMLSLGWQAENVPTKPATAAKTNSATATKNSPNSSRKSPAPVVASAPFEEEVANAADNVDKIELIFRHYFSSEQNTTLNRAAKEQGSFYYWQSLVNLARMYYELADMNVAGDGSARGLLARALKIDRKIAARFATDGGVANRANANKNGRDGESEAADSAYGTLRRSALSDCEARIFAPYFLYRAGREIRKQNRSQAVRFAQVAWDSTSTADSDDLPAKIFSDRISLIITAFASGNHLPIQRENYENLPLPMLGIRLENAYRQLLRAENENRVGEIRELTHLCRQLCLLALNRASALTDARLREAHVPPLLFRFAKLALRSPEAPDYNVARIACASLVREFNPRVWQGNPPTAATRKYFAAAINIMRASAATQVKERGLPIDYDNLIEALQISLRYGERDDDYSALIAAYNDSKQLGLAANFIDSIPPSNSQYVILRMLGAELYLAETRRAAANKNMDAAKKCCEATQKYANEFVYGLRRERGENINGEIDPGRMRKILYAELVKLRARDAAEIDENLRAEIFNFREHVAAARIADDVKNDFNEEAVWLDFTTQMRSLSEAKISAAEMAARAVAAESTAHSLASSVGKTAAATQLSQAWRQISEHASESGDLTVADFARARVSQWLDASLVGAYQNLSQAIVTLRGLVRNRFWQRAADFGDDIIKYWGSGLYTRGNLFAADADLSSPPPLNPAMSANFGKVFPLDQFNAAYPDSEKVTKILNDFILNPPAMPPVFWKNLVASVMTVPPPPNREAVYRQAVYFSATELSAEIKRMLALRPYLEEFDHSETDLLLRRTLTEMAFPQTLYPRPLTRRIFTPRRFYEALTPPEYVSSAGRQKAAVFIAMIDPLISLEAARIVFGSRYPDKSAPQTGGLLEMWKTRMKLTNSRDERDHYRRLVNAVETPLVTLIYGIPDAQGRMVQRDYLRAAQTIETLIAYDLAHPVPDHRGKLPIDGALKRLQQSLKFETALFAAKRSHATAHFGNADYAVAELFARDLQARFPADMDLTLDLAKIYLMEAQYQEHDNAPRAYSIDGVDSTAAMFVRAMTRAASVWRRAVPRSKLWWEANLLMTEIEIAELRARIAAKMTKELVFSVRFQGAKFGDFQLLKVSERPIEYAIKRLQNSLWQNLNNPPFDDEMQMKLASYNHDLEEIIAAFSPSAAIKDRR